jgi:hypothetical protein
MQSSGQNLRHRVRIQARIVVTMRTRILAVGLALFPTALFAKSRNLPEAITMAKPRASAVPPDSTTRGSLPPSPSFFLSGVFHIGLFLLHA